MGFIHSAPTSTSGGATSADRVSYHNPEFPNVEVALDELLYVPLNVTSFSHAHGVRLKGSTLASVTLSWAYNKAVTSQTVAGASRPIADRTLTLPTANLTATTVYSLSATDGTTPDAATATVYFSNDRFFGAAADGLNAAALAAVLSSDRPGPEVKAKTFTDTAGATEKLYYMWPKRLGTVVFTVGGFAGGFDVREEPYTNAAGFTEAYYIAESTSFNLGATTVAAA